MKIGVIRSPDYDWIALYKDGRLISEGHSIQEEDLLQLLGFNFEKIEGTDAQFDEWGGRCPQEWPT